MPSASALACNRWSSGSSTVSASSISMFGMLLVMWKRSLRRGLYRDSSSGKYRSGPLSLGQARISSSFGSSTMSSTLLYEAQDFLGAGRAHLRGGRFQVAAKERFGVG